MSKVPIVEEVRRVREIEAAKHGFDVKAMLAAAKKRQRVPDTALYLSSERIGS
jgi:hypothetical protein